MSYDWVFNSFQVNFCEWFKIGYLFHSLATGCPAFSLPFVLSLPYFLDFFIKINCSDMHEFNFWFSVLLIYESVFMPLPILLISIALKHCLKIRKYRLQICSTFSRLLWLFGVICGLTWILGLIFLFLWKIWDFNRN